jgi:hypothetical protein
MVADHLFTAMDAGKMTIRAGSKDAMTCWTAVTLQKKAGRKTAKVALNEPMPPEAVMPTAGTSGRAFPWKILAKCKNILEHHGHKIYHLDTLLWG